MSFCLFIFLPSRFYFFPPLVNGIPKLIALTSTVLPTMSTTTYPNLDQCSNNRYPILYGSTSTTAVST